MPILKLNRLVVTKSGRRVYDEKFHSGLNIIRGTNGSGKSTISDLIFFALGGELSSWKEYALHCDEVIAEVITSDCVLTLKREVSEEAKRPMRIYFGSLDVAMASAADGWNLHSYSRSQRGQSFSQVLFKALSLPEIPGDEGANITMHQILRLMYVDQSTPYQKIFRLERFDPKDTRRAVAELLCGIGGYQLYSKRIQLRDVDSQLAEFSRQLQSLLTAVSAFRESLSLSSIEAERANAENGRRAALEDLRRVQASENFRLAAEELDDLEQTVVAQYNAAHSKIVEYNDRLAALEFELKDTEEFLSHLRGLLENFNDAALVFSSLGHIAFDYCPACSAPLKEAAHDACRVCGADLSDEDKDSRALALRLDIEGQISESINLQRERTNLRSQIVGQLKALRVDQRRSRERLDEIQLSYSAGASALISEKAREIGRWEARIDELGKLKGIAEDIDKISAEKERITKLRSRLIDEISAIELSQAKRRGTVYSNIAERTKWVLQQDISEHNDFDHIEKFDFSFEDDWFSINGDPNISTSASGMVVVKNSLFVGLLVNAFQDQNVMFPKFLLLDNVEDKGMVESRVKHFQAVIAEISNDAEVDHQIILTTSAINPELDDPHFTIGPSYTKANKTLAIF